MKEVIILRLTPYRENDYIVYALSKDGFVTFRATGGQKASSSSRTSLLLYSLVTVELRETKAGFTLTYIKPIVSSATFFSDYNKLAALNLISETVARVVQTGEEVRETFLLIRNTLESLAKADSVYSLLYLFFTGLLARIGYKFQIQQCVKCGTKQNIVGLNLNLGGLICKNCFENGTIILTEHEINIVRYGFMFNETQFLRHEFTAEEVKKLFVIFMNYFEETYNFTLKSKELL